MYKYLYNMYIIYILHEYNITFLQKLYHFNKKNNHSNKKYNSNTVYAMVGSNN